AGLPDDGHDVIDIAVDRHRQVEGGEGEGLGHVMDDLGFAVGKDVQGAVEVVQRNIAQGHVLDRAAAGIDGDDIADGHDVLDQQEKAGEKVFDQGLSAEPYG